MNDLYYLQYQVANFFTGLPAEAVLIGLVLIAVIAYRLRTALAIGGAVLAFLLASGYLVFIA